MKLLLSAWWLANGACAQLALDQSAEQLQHPGSIGRGQTLPPAAR